MNIENLINDNFLIIIPSLYILGLFLKSLSFDKYIPITLLIVAAVLTISMGDTFTLKAIVDAVIQAILCAGCAVYANQIMKQMKKES